MTATQVKGLRYKIHTDFHDFIPGFEKQAAEFLKTELPDYEGRYSKKAAKKNKGEVEEPITYPYVKSTIESAYEAWIERVVNEKSRRFFPQKDEDNRAVPNTGAYRTVRAIQRVKLADGSQYLTSKSDLHGYDALGEPVNFFASSYPDKWTKTNFRWKTVVNPRTMQAEKVFDGVGSQEEVYEIPFTKENLSELWNQRESDLIQLSVKDETGNVHDIKDVIPQKRFELLRDSDFDYLFKANYIPDAIKEEMRKEALAQGLYKGGNVSDYSNTSSANTSNTNKNVYK
jgi:hypothetical protein